MNQQSLYPVSFKDEHGTYEVKIDGKKRLEDAREALLWKLRGEASNYIFIRDVYTFKTGGQWVRDPPSSDLRCRLIKDYKPEDLLELECFVWKNYSNDAPTLNKAPVQSKVIEEQVTAANSGNPKISIYVKPTDTTIGRYIPFSTVLKDLKADLIKMDDALDEKKEYYFRNKGKPVHDERKMLDEIQEMGKVDLELHEKESSGES